MSGMRSSGGFVEATARRVEGYGEERLLWQKALTTPRDQRFRKQSTACDRWTVKELIN